MLAGRRSFADIAARVEREVSIRNRDPAVRNIWKIW